MQECSPQLNFVATEMTSMKGGMCLAVYPSWVTNPAAPILSTTETTQRFATRLCDVLYEANKAIFVNVPPIFARDAHLLLFDDFVTAANATSMFQRVVKSRARLAPAIQALLRNNPDCVELLVLQASEAPPLTAALAEAIQSLERVRHVLSDAQVAEETIAAETELAALIR
jgi:hypothetical protein